MNKEEKNKFLQKLHNDEFHGQIISSIKNELDRKQIKNFTDEIFISLVESLSNLIKLEENESKTIPKE